MQNEVQKVQRFSYEQATTLSDAMKQSKAATAELDRAEKSANAILVELKKANPDDIIKAGNDAKLAAVEASKAKLFRYTVVRVGSPRQIDIRDTRDPGKVYQVTLSLGQ